MNSVAVAIIAVFFGALLVLLIGGMGALVYLHLKANRAHAELLARMEAFEKSIQESFSSFGEDLEATLTKYQGESVTLIDGARSSFTGIRQDMKASHDALAKGIAEVLTKHEMAFKESIGRINGEALLKASMQALQATKEISALCFTLKNLLVDHQAPAAETELGPEEYAPSDTIYTKMSEAARMDAAIADMEAADNEPQFSTGFVG